MVNKRRLISWGLLLICWIFFVCIILMLSANNELNTSYNQLENYNPDSSGLPTNQLEAFSYIRFDSKANYRPIYAIAFEKLLLENNNFGPFKTAIHKRAMINDLQLRFYNCTPADAVKSSISEDRPVNAGEHTKTETTNIPLASNVPAIDAKELINEAADVLTRPSSNHSINFTSRYSVGNFNFANVSEVCADKFDCRFFYEDTLLLYVHCRKAAVSYRNSSVELCGHVTIRTKDGVTLQSNYVEWDVRNKIFRVNSLYVLNRNGAVKTGRNACFDFGLNEVLTHQAKNCTKEEHKCVAKL